MEEFDVTVAGAGMAGLAASATLAQAGVRTLLLEKGPEVGGSMRLSGGTIWTAGAMEYMVRHMPGGSREHQKQIVEGLSAELDWLASVGVPHHDLAVGEGKFGREVDVDLMSRRLSASVASAGGAVSHLTRLAGLRGSSRGGVTSVVVSSEGQRTEIPMDRVILATGGFQGSSEYRQRFIPGWPDELILRSNPHSDGAGLRAALSLDAATSPEMDGFYGHTMPDVDIPPSRWIEVTAYFTQDAVVVDSSGRRFFDESVSLTDEVAPMAIVRRPDARAVLLMDDAVYQGGILGLHSPMAQRAKPAFDASQELGAPNIVADSWEEVADGAQLLGVDGPEMLRTITEFNEAVLAGTTDQLAVPRARHQHALVHPPFRALAVRPGITFTLGGISIDTDMRVLKEDGSPVPGLYAAGADAGGTYGGGYMGGLAMALVQGRIAARSILAELG